MFRLVGHGDVDIRTKEEIVKQSKHLNGDVMLASKDRRELEQRDQIRLRL